MFYFCFIEANVLPQGKMLWIQIDNLQVSYACIFTVCYFLIALLSHYADLFLALFKIVFCCVSSALVKKVQVLSNVWCDKSK